MYYRKEKYNREIEEKELENPNVSGFLFFNLYMGSFMLNKHCG